MDGWSRFQEMSDVWAHMGLALAMLQEIEDDLAHAWVFGIPRNRKPGKTVGDLLAERERMTFGQLLTHVTNWWDMDPELERLFAAFLVARNDFVHRFALKKGHDVALKRDRQRMLKELREFLDMLHAVREITRWSRSAADSAATFLFNESVAANERVEIPHEIQEEAAMFTSLVKLRNDLE